MYGEFYGKKSRVVGNFGGVLGAGGLKGMIAFKRPGVELGGKGEKGQMR